MDVTVAMHPVRLSDLEELRDTWERQAAQLESQAEQAKDRYSPSGLLEADRLICMATTLKACARRVAALVNQAVEARLAAA